MMEFNEFRSTMRWGSTDGKWNVVRDLETDHVVNILNWIKAHPDQYQAGLYEMFEQEANYRKVLAFANNEPIPEKLADGRWVTMKDGVATNLHKDLTHNKEAI